MGSQLFFAVVAALLSSLFTVALAWLVFERRVRGPLERRLADLQERLGETIRRQVRQGILDGVASLPTSDLIQKAQRAMTDTAADFLRGGLGVLMGEPPDRR